MPVTTSYPGVYIEELPSLVHTIRPAPTSIAVFVGYTNPFFPRTNFLTAVQLFSFADYQANFGGFFSSPWQPDLVGQAVFQFFQNGGPTCYVVAVQASTYYDNSTPPQPMGSVEAATVTIPGGGAGETISLTALQPVGVTPGGGAAPAGTVGIAMQVAISNVQQTVNPYDTADIVLSYGTNVETYRKVQVTGLVTALQNSNLVTVTLSATAPTQYPTTGSPFSLAYTSPPDVTWTVLNPPIGLGPQPSGNGVFEDNASLDKVAIFNLLATPGITNSSVTSEAVAYCERKRAFYIMDTPSPSKPPPPATSPPTAPTPPLPQPPWDVNDLVQDPANAVGKLPGQHECGTLLPLARHDRPGDGGRLRCPAERVRGRHIRPRGQRAGCLEVPGRHRDGPPRHDGRRSERGYDRSPAGGPQRERAQLP